MYLCIGKAVTYGHIREAIGRDCGKCNGVVRESVDSCTQNRSHEPALRGIRLVAVG